MTNEIKTHTERLQEHGFVNHEHNCELYRAEITELRAKVESLAADAERQKLPNQSDLIDKIRSFGFTTYGQSVQLAYAIIDMAKGKA